MRVIISILIVFVFAACSQKDKIPSGILSQQKVRLIMWDLMRADEYINGLLMKNSTLDLSAERFSLYEQIFRLHSTNREKFKKSLSFYQGRPDLLKVITDSLRSDEKNALKNQYQDSKPFVDTIPHKPNIESIRQRPNIDSIRHRLNIDSIQRKRIIDTTTPRKRNSRPVHPN
jgi:hypothetical protein